MADKNTALTAAEFVAMAEKNEDSTMVEKVPFVSDINGCDSQGYTPLICASHWNMKRTAALLIQQGADPDKKNIDGYSALIYASEHNDSSMATILLEAGANPNITNKDGWTPLMCSSFLGLYNTVKALLAAGADIGIRNLSSQTALDIARSRDKESIEVLIENHIMKRDCPIPIGIYDCPVIDDYIMPNEM